MELSGRVNRFQGWPISPCRGGALSGADLIFTGKPKGTPTFLEVDSFSILFNHPSFRKPAPFPPGFWPVSVKKKNWLPKKVALGFVLGGSQETHLALSPSRPLALALQALAPLEPKRKAEASQAAAVASRGFWARLRPGERIGSLQGSLQDLFILQPFETWLLFQHQKEGKPPQTGPFWRET